ncbi:MPN527 family putative ECF transporter permease subunit [[Mycoplasma] mobile]|uniref:Uncharacterized protein n=1 Tax=Mycoplasma mobile (strain ATCC 43663 / 163K / NCTC 11711) TaxID=267748 RepID=Q6KI23_MYCM1|nr:hypothetical protein [[Mycoplasma] mobile]AAT27753.1 conserved hypothetical protein [Mycoplasma mobile 163K]
MSGTNFWNNSRIVYNITLSGIFFALVLIFQSFFSLFSIFGFLNINFTIVFIIILALVSNFKYALILLILRFIIGPAINSGYSEIGILGHFILLVSDVFFILFFTFAYYVLLTWKQIKLNKYIILIISSITATIFNAFWMVFLNGLIFTPLFFALLGQNSANFLFYMQPQIWNSLKGLFFNINTYWGGIFTLYTAFNLINFSLVSILFSSITIALFKAKIIENFDLKTFYFQKNFKKLKMNK